MSLIAIVKNEDIVALNNKISIENNKKIDKKILDEQDEYGNTALHYAMKSGNWYIIKFLLDQGADMSIENKEGLLAHQMAKPDSIRRFCVETKMKEKKEEKKEEKKPPPKPKDINMNVAQNMGFSSNTVRLKNGIEKHSELITNRLKETKDKLSQILVNMCNAENCYNNANCLFDCGHIVYCMDDANKLLKEKNPMKCPYCGADITKIYEIIPVV